ncbi:hypothetical protein [Streptomyces sp. NPDC057616]|uniref:hypothetical protein n=1 Tax=Streptomyces sp. NPDC057616 TaxID=3346183 RepID=UPI0036A76DF4
MNVFKYDESIVLDGFEGATMKHKPAREWATTAGESAGLVSMCVLWAAVVAVSPWLPEVVGILDLSGVSVFLSMLICGVVSSLLLGVLLGRARACRLLATCGAAGPCLWILDLTVLSDPDVHSSDAVAVAFAGVLGLVLVIAPLMAGAVAGRFCRRPRAAQ